MGLVSRRRTFGFVASHSGAGTCVGVGPGAARTEDVDPLGAPGAGVLLGPDEDALKSPEPDEHAIAPNDSARHAIETATDRDTPLTAPAPVMVGFAQVLVAVALVGVSLWFFAGVALRLGGWLDPPSSIG